MYSFRALYSCYNRTGGNDDNERPINGHTAAHPAAASELLTRGGGPTNDTLHSREVSRGRIISFMYCAALRICSDVTKPLQTVTRLRAPILSHPTNPTDPTVPTDPEPSRASPSVPERPRAQMRLKNAMFLRISPQKWEFLLDFSLRETRETREPRESVPAPAGRLQAPPPFGFP